ncbi:MAG TPA: tryptophan 2,3-dioxygenase family protein [Planctomycetota bacterium]|nr:tryptophan 2,3-dioxygenase family protein [Planctomycetota bacterium]
MAEAPSDITYGSYLKIPELLALQKPLSGPQNHDEMHFIVIHQVFELWFRLMLHEVRAIDGHLAAGRVAPAVHLFKRLNAILAVFFPQIEVIETMTPGDFLKFRDLLKPASGFQSVQFRELEFLSGARDERYLRMFEGDPDAQGRLKSAMTAPTLWQRFQELLASRGFDVASESAEVASIVRIYRDESNADVRSLCEEMIQYDKLFSLWREHHVRMAERMIGMKAGTGQKAVEYSFGGKAGPMGTMGVEYLQKTLTKRFFPALWAARSEL